MVLKGSYAKFCGDIFSFLKINIYFFLPKNKNILINIPIKKVTKT